MVNSQRRYFLCRFATVITIAASHALVGATGVLAVSGKNELHDLDEGNGGRGKEIDDRRLSDEGGRGNGSDNSGRNGRPKDHDVIEIAKKELESEKDERRRRYSDPLYPDRERF